MVKKFESLLLCHFTISYLENPKTNICFSYLNGRQGGEGDRQGALNGTQRQWGMMERLWNQTHWLESQLQCVTLASD